MFMYENANHVVIKYCFVVNLCQVPLLYRYLKCGFTFYFVRSTRSETVDVRETWNHPL